MADQTHQSPRVPIGLEILSLNDSDSEILYAISTRTGFNFCVQQISKAHFSTLTDVPLGDSGVNSLRHDLVNISDSEIAPYFYGGISSWLELAGTDNDSVEVVRQRSELQFRHEVNWASHIGLSGVVFPFPESTRSNRTETLSVANYARWIGWAVQALTHAQPVVRVPLSASSWSTWNAIRCLCEHNSKLGIALELSAEHSIGLDAEAVLPWIAEPLRVVILSTNLFLTNQKGFPVLSKLHQSIVRKLLRLHVKFVISSASAEGTHPQGGLSAYMEYVQHLHRTQPPLDDADRFASGYQDYLQAPLQPLMDNLESATYEVFEQDPIKYQQYEKAVYAALMDRGDPVRPTVIMVVGAGRGPLVDRSLKAAAQANKPVRLYAVEKNPNAIITLKLRKERIWGDSVTVVHSDMRYWSAPEKADILVSELLGSFGDNELSPECLDGAMKFLKETGISIPSSYTSYVAPLASQKLYNEVTSQRDPTHVETPYVVKFQSVEELAPPAAVWTFRHPGSNEQAPPGTVQFNIHNTRYGAAKFTISHDTVMHGIAGYFEAVLYKDVMLSIHPATHSPGMFSWFPLFFPLKVPMFLSKGSNIDLHFWRCSDSRKVWYEWCAVPSGAGCGASSGLHNINGRSYWVGL
ncbi:PRMT5 arginine-N-methyltransferase-domain-containing protein [Cladochytrium replicatum]|nr:PRMT5 arginine-N-methyltransferase-domain-containing protein [Cladochytrium replicatum]